MLDFFPYSRFYSKIFNDFFVLRNKIALLRIIPPKVILIYRILHLLTLSPALSAILISIPAAGERPFAEEVALRSYSKVSASRTRRTSEDDEEDGLLWRRRGTRREQPAWNNNVCVKLIYSIAELRMSISVFPLFHQA